MADTLALETPKVVTLEATATNLHAVTVPAGTRTLWMHSAAAFYVQFSGAEGDARTAAASYPFVGPANIPWVPPGCATEARTFLFWGTNASQEVSFLAQKEP